LLLAAPSVPGSQSAPVPAAFTCPAFLKLAKSDRKFERPSIYNGTPGKREYELAPGDTVTKGKDVRQTWNLADYRDMNLFVRCRYIGTKETVTLNLPAPLKTCEFTFRDMPGNQPVASPVFACK
jgi:hypothetical protein